MKTEAHFLPLSIRLFFRCFLLFFPLFYLIQVIIRLLMEMPENLFSGQILYRSLLFALAISLIPMLASRKMKLIVSFLQHREPLQNWLINYFDNLGWQINSNNEISVEFQSPNKVNRLLNLDKTSVFFENHEIVITGPYRVIDDVYSHLKYDQHDFQ